MSQTLTIKVTQDINSIRVDQYIYDYLQNSEIDEIIEELSRSLISKLIQSGQVRVNEKKIKPSLILHGGENIFIEIPEVQSGIAEAQNLPLQIVYEDSDIILVNKASGMATHPGAGRPDGTLVNALLYHC